MNSQISADYYHREQISNSEQENIFSKTWVFAGFSHDFEKPNDFKTIKINGTPIVIQNLRGEIKAFLNVCSHRFSLIQSEKSGNRPLICPYHGWAYSNKGIPTGIPKKPLFKKYSKEELCKMKLDEYNVEKCGNLYFISKDKNIIPLRDFLGGYFDEIELMSNSFGERVDVNRLDIRSNWKVIIENTMEAYHLGLVHSDTLANLMPVTSMENLTFSFNSPHSNYLIPLLIKENSKKLKYLHKHFSQRIFKVDGFIHYLIFPNLLISSSYGTTFNVSIINPVSASKTEFISNVFLSKLNEGSELSDVSDFANTAVDYNRKVFDEDKIACEAVQEGVKYTSQPGVLSLEEERVHKFQQDYLNYLK